MPNGIIAGFVHWRIKVTYQFKKKVDQKVNLGIRQIAAHRPTTLF